MFIQAIVQNILTLSLVLTLSFEVLASDVMRQESQADDDTTAAKPAGNIGPVSDAVSPPVVDAVAQAEDIGSAETKASEHGILRPAQNVNLKEVVSKPLQPSDAPVASEATQPPAGKLETGGSDAVLQGMAESELSPVVMRREPSAPEVDSETPKNAAQEIAGEETDVQQTPFVLLKNEVLPGTTTRLAWSPDVSFMGISAPTAVLVLNGVKRGPTLCLTAAIHGDELNGIEIVRRVLYDIDPQELSGAIIGVPIVNLEGFRSGSRYLSDRRDLNRFFPGNPYGSSASRIAYSFFHEVISYCDMLIDLHTGSFRRTNLPQLRADLSYPAVEKLSQKMGAIVVVQSQGAEGSLRRAATENGIPAVTLEAGAPHELQKSAVDYGVKSVESALNGLGLIDRRSFWQRADEPVYYNSTWVRAREGGILLSEVELGQTVKQGELLGVVTDPITNQRYEIQSTYTGRVIGMALNQVMHPGFAAYHIGIKASVIDPPGELSATRVEGEAPGQALPSADSASPFLDTMGEEEDSDEGGSISSMLSEPGEESDE